MGRVCPKGLPVGGLRGWAASGGILALPLTSCVTAKVLHLTVPQSPYLVSYPVWGAIIDYHMILGSL